MTPIPPTTRPRGLIRGLVAAACLAVAGCASAGGGSGGTAPPPGAPSAGGAGTGSGAGDYVEADAAFMRHMIHHHAQAIVMARMAPDRSASPAVRRLAARILNSQKTEISLMADWLRARGEPVPETAALARDAADDAGAGEDGGTGEGGGHDAGDEHAGHDAGAAADPGPLEGWDEGPRMPGVLSDEQMARLAAARGEEFDRLFLTYMIDHHDGAVVMVKNLVEQPGAAREESVFRLASGIRADQAMEIDRMRNLLREQLFGPGNQ